MPPQMSSRNWCLCRTRTSFGWTNSSSSNWQVGTFHIFKSNTAQGKANMMKQMRKKLSKVLKEVCLDIRLSKQKPSLAVSADKRGLPADGQRAAAANRASQWECFHTLKFTFRFSCSELLKLPLQMYYSCIPAKTGAKFWDKDISVYQWV